MRRPPDGFGLLEAIVALALLASAGIVLFSWINTNLLTANRLQEVEAEARLKLAAAEAMAQINPLRTSQGDMVVGEISIAWTTEPATPVTPNATFEGGQAGGFELALFRTKVQARQVPREFAGVVAGATSPAAVEVRFEMVLVGYRRVRDVARDA
jgi:general secretion pathway protein I